MMGVSSSSLLFAGGEPQPLWNWFRKLGPTPTPFHLIVSSSLLLHSSFTKHSPLCHVPRLKGIMCENKASCFPIDIFASANAFRLFLFDGGEVGKGSGMESGTHSVEPNGGSPFNQNKWTYALLATNVLVYVAQLVTQGKLLLLGAKINSLIDEGQLWRLATSSFLHGNIGHLMVNCYSLNSIGPTVENLTGPKRFLAVYFTSAIASSATSYWFSKSPSVGASGAIFGLVGSLAVFIIRHRGMLKGGKEELQHIAQVIFLNMAIGMLSEGIDNWGHFGGLLGGVAVSWLIGPVWKYESRSNDGRRIFVDKAPIKYLTNGRFP